MLRLTQSLRRQLTTPTRVLEQLLTGGLIKSIAFTPHSVCRSRIRIEHCGVPQRYLQKLYQGPPKFNFLLFFIGIKLFYSCSLCYGNKNTCRFMEFDLFFAKNNKKGMNGTGKPQRRGEVKFDTLLIESTRL